MISAIVLIGNIVAGDKDSSPVDQTVSVNSTKEEEPTLDPVEEEIQPVTEEPAQKPVTFTREKLNSLLLVTGMQVLRL